MPENRTAADELMDYLKDLPTELQIEELCKSFCDMLEFVLFLGLQDDYEIWERDKTEYKKMRVLTHRFYDTWTKKNQNPEQEN